MQGDFFGGGVIFIGSGKLFHLRIEEVLKNNMRKMGTNSRNNNSDASIAVKIQIEVVSGYSEGH